MSIKNKLLKSFILLSAKEKPNNAFVVDIEKKCQPFGDVVKKLKASKPNWDEQDNGNFIWITGLPRTCGAYLTRSLSLNLGADIPSAVYRNESIPLHREFSTWTSDTRLNIEFQQLFSYLRTSAQNLNLIVKKNSGLGARPDSLIPVINFEKIESILITIRPPGQNYVSWKNSGLNLESLSKYSEVKLPSPASMPPDWQSEATMSFFMDAWEKYYSNFLQRLPLGLKEKIYVVDFGNANSIIADLCKKHGVTPELEALKNRSQENVPSFFHSDEVVQRQQLIYEALHDQFGKT